MKRDAIKVGDCLVNGGRRGTVMVLGSVGTRIARCALPRESLGEHRLNQHVLVIEEKHRDGLLSDAWKLMARGAGWELVDVSGGAEEKVHVNLVAPAT